MNIDNKRYVEATPVNQSSPYFICNVKPGDVVCFKSSDILDTLKNKDMMLHKPVTVVHKTPYLLRLDLGKYKVSISLASIYCKDEVLYFYEPNELS